ncbi:MAG TPA: hypothetical protein VNJ08_00200 [Bacteriovoracaceae bacterium]|nr:hypothetical protein [Bacteriovoracaceae bacterium]
MALALLYMYYKTFKELFINTFQKIATLLLISLPFLTNVRADDKLCEASVTASAKEKYAGAAKFRKYALELQKESVKELEDLVEKLDKDEAGWMDNLAEHFDTPKGSFSKNVPD